MVHMLRLQLLYVCMTVLQWLEHEFMPYLDEWKASSEQKGGEAKDVARRLLSQETLQGISITGRIYTMIV